MDIPNGVKLTNTVYKLLEFFPESDPLKYRAKDRALAIMSAIGGLAQGRENLICEDIDILLSYLWIAKGQGWMSPANYLIIANEYENIKKWLAPVEVPKQPPQEEESAVEQEYFQTEIKERGSAKDEFVGEQEEPLRGIAPRQRKILEFLSINEKAQVMELQKVLPEVTKRTIRRDLDELMEAGKIIRLGDFNQIYYQVKRQI